MHRRGFLLGALATPFVARKPGLLMPVRAHPVPPPVPGLVGTNALWPGIIEFFIDEWERSAKEGSC